MRKSSTSIIILIIGGALGVLGGILFAPTSGSNTRGALSYQLRRLREKIQELIKELVLVSTKTRVTSKAKAAGQEVVDKTVNKAKQLLREADELVAQLKGND